MTPCRSLVAQALLKIMTWPHLSRCSHYACLRWYQPNPGQRGHWATLNGFTRVVAKELLWRLRVNAVCRKAGLPSSPKNKSFVNCMSLMTKKPGKIAVGLIHTAAQTIAVASSLAAAKIPGNLGQEFAEMAGNAFGTP